jgi:hypothetical protein
LGVREIEPGIAFEYAVLVGECHIGRVRKADISARPRMIVERRYCERQSHARAIEARPLQVETVRENRQ